MITLNVYDRRPDTEHSFLGTLQVKPVLVHDHAVDQWYKCVFVLGPLVSLYKPCLLDYGRLRTKS